MKYSLKLRDDTTKIHPVQVSIPGEENLEAAVAAGLEHLKHLGFPFLEFTTETDLMEVEMTAPENPVVEMPAGKTRKGKCLPLGFKLHPKLDVGPPLVAVPMTEAKEWTASMEKTFAGWPKELPPQDAAARDEDYGKS